jgi:hypothetical protein
MPAFGTSWGICVSEVRLEPIACTSVLAADFTLDAER